jgi:hypothetical protein
MSHRLKLTLFVLGLTSLALRGLFAAGLRTPMVAAGSICDGGGRCVGESLVDEVGTCTAAPLTDNPRTSTKSAIIFSHIQRPT